ncbi:MAG: glycine--tRNA ligase [Candidatus Gracilibacteria bacterium]|jgi:glycyl-tRNA synthetase|nr:glycine--tRNA ligase [Candidatus Gracilibacteria bacterium]
MAKEQNKLEKIASLCKRRGIIFPGSEIYGGLANTWDYGPYGSQLKKNVRDFWWKYFVEQREDMVGLDSGILLNPKVWEASGHVGNFSDPLMDCKKCKERFRGDKLIEEALGVETAAKVSKDFKEIYKIVMENQIKCPNCGALDYTEPREFNMMFKTHQGVIEEKSNAIYLRPETAQGIFLNFKNIIQNTRVKLPFGVGQTGKSFRNEITPGNFTFRTREFDQMEIEYFMNPNDEKAIYEKYDNWIDNSKKWYMEMGIKEENMRYRDHDPKELSHYSKRTTDIEYMFPFGWGELQGIAYRTDFDLTQHEKFSGEDLKYRDPQTNEKYIPHVIEPAWGLDRTVLAILCEAYDEEEVNGETRTVLRLSPKVAPVKVAVFPLMKKEELSKIAESVYSKLKKSFVCEYDDSGTIGKRYRRQDEIGTPYCVTIDFDSIEKGTITIRDRDSLKQDIVKIDELSEYFIEKGL